MPLDFARVRPYLGRFDFPGLFTRELGWDRQKATLEVAADGRVFTLAAVAEKRGMVAYQCPAPEGEPMPPYALRRKVEQRVAKSVREHLIIFTDAGETTQIWQWVKREHGGTAACREHTYHRGQPGDALIQKLQALEVTLEEEEVPTLIDTGHKVKAAFDVDKVTKRFYERFKTEHAALLKFIKGFPPPVKAAGKTEPHPDLQWYTSLMLNRLMFVYFIQKKGFLDGDPDYLRNRLAMVRNAQGKDKLQSFYRYFLLRLFHDGLGSSPADRGLDPAMEKLLGRVPFLDGGFFEVHALERRYRDIDISDRAFETLFGFFDQYQWRLDDRPLRKDNELNPDVVGYIFEKYVNQKQMGAYYTKEDITEYISKNTVIPYLFDAAKKKCAIAFQPGGALWRLLRDDPDRYIYPAVRRGVIDRQGHVIPLPADIAAGLDDAARRGGWNRRADAPYGLPTETWREHVARRRRCLQVREKLRAGEVADINDLVTLNLDIWQFARDAILNAEGPDLLRAFWHTLAGRAPERSSEAFEPGMTVLDPMCGSGAFLFAALRILETLYSDCLERMGRFVEEEEGGLSQFSRHTGDDTSSPTPSAAKMGLSPSPSTKYRDFQRILAQLAQHPNERYFILKTIIINNLYGVDIMQEAVEICKLRLFLKLAAQVETADQVEPLPDVDFNIRAGNTLVGYTSLDAIRRAAQRDSSGQGKLTFGDAAEAVQRIEEEAALVGEAFRRLRARQATQGGEVTPADKQGLCARLAALDDELDRCLAGEYGVNAERPNDFAAWKAAHEPFHWCVEFYGIISAGGFDVVVGNPPYVSAAKVRRAYAVRQYATERCSDIYAWCLERVSQLVQSDGRTGMIVPLSLGFSGDFDVLRSLLYRAYCTNWFSSFGRIPAALFAHDVRVRNTIHLGSKRGHGRQYTTRLHRWFDSERGALLSLMSYARFDPTRWSNRIPKLNTQALMDAFEEAAEKKANLSTAISPRPTKHRLSFKKTAYNWLNFCRKLPPCYDKRGERIPHTQFDGLYPWTEADATSLYLLLNGKLALAFWLAVGDDFHVAKWMFAELPADIAGLSDEDRQALGRLAGRLETAMNAAASFKRNAGKRVGNYNLARCRAVTDASDAVFARAFGFEHVWEDIELLYVQCVRTDFSDGADGGQE